MLVRFIDNIHLVDAAQWNYVVDKSYPFLRHEFLLALEQSHCVSKQTGWQPRHLLIEDGSQLIACLPLYIKTHSYGEYVFDQSWAQAYEQHGLAYYPKLVSAIPFTPAAGPRLSSLVDLTEIIPIILAALKEQCLLLGASSWHGLFLDKPFKEALEKEQSLLRLACQFHWHNHQFRDFEHFLETFSSRKRKDVRKERKKLHEQGIQCQQWVAGEITDKLWNEFFINYQNTYLRKSGHQGYLNKTFFALLRETMSEHLLLVTASLNGEIIATALNLFSDDVLYGRYWGSNSLCSGLHFEVCYYQGIEFCIKHGLKKFDAGAQGEHKVSRGFEPIKTYSAHHIMHSGFNAAIADFLIDEAAWLGRYLVDVTKMLPFNSYFESTDHCT